jgi:multiple antibiotic resistance protein
MQEIAADIFTNALYLLALINPISKVSVLSFLASKDQRKELRNVTTRSSVVAALILVGAMVCGDFVLRSVFHVELHSLRFAGGFILFFVGFNALRKGVFFEQEAQNSFADIALVVSYSYVVLPVIY